VINPTINAAYKPTRGSTPAINAKATASGTKARATVRPDRTSFLMVLRREAEFSNIRSARVMNQLKEGIELLLIA